MRRSRLAISCIESPVAGDQVERSRGPRVKQLFAALIASLVSCVALAQTLPLRNQNPQPPGAATIVSPRVGASDGTGAATASTARANFSEGEGEGDGEGTMATQNANDVAITGGTITGLSSLATTGESGAPLTTDQARLTSQLNNPAGTAEYIYGSAIGKAGQSVYDAAAIRGTATQTPGSKNWTVDGVSGFVLNNQAGGNATKSAVGVLAVNICGVDNCQSWGMDSITTDAVGFTSATSGVGRRLFGNESDLNVSSPNTTGISYFAGGTVLTTGNPYLVAFQAGNFAGASKAKWSRAFVSPDGAAVAYGYVGLQSTSGKNISSQPITFAYTDSSGVEHYPMLLATPNGLQATANAIIPGSPKSTSLGSSSLPFRRTYTQLVELVPYTVSTLPMCDASRKNALASVADASTPTWNAPLKGGGSTSVMALCNGTIWTAH